VGNPCLSSSQHWSMPVCRSWVTVYGASNTPAAIAGLGLMQRTKLQRVESSSATSADICLTKVSPTDEKTLPPPTPAIRVPLGCL